MEFSPLTLAHSHARNALSETRKSNPVAASEEHDLAAGEFAALAQNGVDPDALRTLQLLEKHHKRLAEILRFKHENPTKAAQPDPNTAPESTDTEPIPSRALSTDAISSPESLQQPPRLSSPGRARHRGPTSIASNLATARGIPSHPPRANPASPTLSAQNAGAKMADSPARKEHSDLSYAEAQSQRNKNRQRTSSPPLPPNSTEVREGLPADTNGTAMAGLRSLANDESFQRFYSTFEGLISKLSAPLAFASLPLGTEQAHQRSQSAQKAAPETKLDRQQAAADRSGQSQSNPDVNKLVSSAALRAIKDKNGPVAANNVAESFYVVPTAGGTISYAGILSRAEKDAQKNSVDENDEDFVDAREEPASPEVTRTPGHENRTGKNVVSGDGRGAKTKEELQLENNALKHLSDTLSKRLHMWEVNAQSSSMALQQSLRAMQSHGVASPANQMSPSASAAAEAPGPSGEGDGSRLKELEELVRRGEKELQRVEGENEKLKGVVGRYRERWEKLKEGARVRREGNGHGDDGNRSRAPAALSPALDDDDDGPGSKE